MVAIATESSTLDHDFIKKKTKKSSYKYFITYVFIGICNLLNSDINNSKYPLDFGLFILKDITSVYIVITCVGTPFADKFGR